MSRMNKFRKLAWVVLGVVVLGTAVFFAWRLSRGNFRGAATIFEDLRG